MFACIHVCVFTSVQVCVRLVDFTLAGNIEILIYTSNFDCNFFLQILEIEKSGPISLLIQV